MVDGTHVIFGFFLFSARLVPCRLFNIGLFKKGKLISKTVKFNIHNAYMCWSNSWTHVCQGNV
jgi:hypothetical protein